MPSSIVRLLRPHDRSFFLFGPRGVGKSTWLKTVLPDARRFDLLESSLALELARTPGRLEDLIGPLPADSWVIMDEIQKVPVLLNEVHRLMENHRWRFVLCGSSARTLRRRGANLLAGRAVTLHMGPFSFGELRDHFDIDAALAWGLLPVVQADTGHAADILDAYLNTTIKEEIRAEGIIRNAGPFLRFLAIAGQMNAQTVSASNIAREAEVARANVDAYFAVLVDTLLGHFLPAYQPRLKVRERSHPKFYWFDAGVARAAAGYLRDPVDPLWRGGALETTVFHELRVFNETAKKGRDIAHYRTAGGSEIDFVVETRKARQGTPPAVVCIEVKSAGRWDPAWERAMRSLKAHPGIQVDRMIGVYMGERRYHVDGVDVLPIDTFLEALHRGEVF